MSSTSADVMAQRTWRSILAGQIAEVLFSGLPLVVVVLVLYHRGHAERFSSSPEWSFGAAILFGQSVIRFVLGLVRSRGATNTGPVALVLALVVVLGLVPSLLVLTMTLQSVEESKPVETWLQFSQVFFFVLSVIAYLLLGTVGETISRAGETARQ